MTALLYVKHRSIERINSTSVRYYRSLAGDACHFSNRTMCVCVCFLRSASSVLCAHYSLCRFSVKCQTATIDSLLQWFRVRRKLDDGKRTRINRNITKGMHISLASNVCMLLLIIVSTLAACLFFPRARSVRCLIVRRVGQIRELVVDRYISKSLTERKCKK